MNKKFKIYISPISYILNIEKNHSDYSRFMIIRRNYNRKCNDLNLSPKKVRARTSDALVSAILEVFLPTTPKPREEGEREEVERVEKIGKRGIEKKQRQLQMEQQYQPPSNQTM